ncbi:MAG: 50S ribosomal protein L18 [Eubacteriales bacterium]|nr:50S ribosomal protein L18 [Bacillota bacterium]MBV1728179.1 50S ribosomal protein L18 [Desulforudis sp.]MDP3050909.1 50S ribosomal protein L18 [Eubacteriales bacterium]MDQ7789993.1 50S ribosomal protein L18 [Clostridia bacterium]MBU4533898.1 50S ribosomal protein L18 [Bacillota bacterium]
MTIRATRRVTREKRRGRVRNKISGTATCPRLNVFRSLNNIYAQVIDDETGTTLCSVSSISPELREKLASGSNTEAAKAVGELLAEKAKEKGITSVVFDRAGYLYHGRVKAVAEGARAGGLKF